MRYLISAVLIAAGDVILIRLFVRVQVDYRLHDLRKVIMNAALACPTCHGGGTLSMPGATRRCPYCLPMRRIIGLK